MSSSSGKSSIKESISKGWEKFKETIRSQGCFKGKPLKSEEKEKQKDPKAPTAKESPKAKAQQEAAGIKEGMRQKGENWRGENVEGQEGRSTHTPEVSSSGGNNDPYRARELGKESPSKGKGKGMEL